jgi:phosphatidylglycerophosphate synthase
MFHPYNILAGILFGGVGMGAFAYGKRLELWQPVTIGLALMFYPWFVSSVWLTWSIGVVLCLLLWRYHSE